jgi:UDP-N-acetylglucosamine acyltransferase
LFIQNRSTSTAINIVNDKVAPGELKDEILQFVQNSKIGIIKRFSKNEVVDED